MALLDGEKIFRDVQDNRRDINDLSREEVLAAKSYIATKKQKTFNTQQPLAATKSGQAQLKKAASAPKQPKPKAPPAEKVYKPTVQQEKTWGTQLDEYLTKNDPLYPSAKRVVEKVVQNPYVSSALGALGAGASSVSDIVAEQIDPTSTKTVGESLSKLKSGFGKGGADYLRQQGVTEPRLGALKDFSSRNFVELLSSAFGGLQQAARPPLDITKGIYEQSAMKFQGLSPEQAKQASANWVAQNPNWAGTSSNLFGTVLDPLNLPIGGALAKLNTALKRTTSTAAVPQPQAQAQPQPQTQARPSGRTIPKQVPKPAKPVQPSPAPVAQPAPVPPVTQAPTPVVQAPTPTAQVPTPVTQVPTPTAQVPTPVTQPPVSKPKVQPPTVQTPNPIQRPKIEKTDKDFTTSNKEDIDEFRKLNGDTHIEDIPYNPYDRSSVTHSFKNVANIADKDLMKLVDKYQKRVDVLAVKYRSGAKMKPIELQQLYSYRENVRKLIQEEQRRDAANKPAATPEPAAATQEPPQPTQPITTPQAEPTVPTQQAPEPQSVGGAAKSEPSEAVKATVKGQPIYVDPKNTEELAKYRNDKTFLEDVFRTKNKVEYGFIKIDELSDVSLKNILQKVTTRKADLLDKQTTKKLTKAEEIILEAADRTIAAIKSELKIRKSNQTKPVVKQKTPTKRGEGLMYSPKIDKSKPINTSRYVNLIRSGKVSIERIIKRLIMDEDLPTYDTFTEVAAALRGKIVDTKKPTTNIGRTYAYKFDSEETARSLYGSMRDYSSDDVVFYISGKAVFSVDKSSDLFQKMLRKEDGDEQDIIKYLNEVYPTAFVKKRGEGLTKPSVKQKGQDKPKLTPREQKKFDGYQKRIDSKDPDEMLDPDELEEYNQLAAKLNQKKLSYSDVVPSKPPKASIKILQQLRKDLLVGRKPVLKSKFEEEFLRYPVQKWVDPQKVAVADPPKPDANKKTMAMNITELNQLIRREIGRRFPVRSGRMVGSDSWAYFITNEGIIRIMKDLRITTVAHEIGHALDITFGIMNAMTTSQMKDIVDLAMRVYPKHLPKYTGGASVQSIITKYLNNYPAPDPLGEVIVREAIAEYFRLYFTDAAAAKSLAPDFAALVEKKVPKDFMKSVDKVAAEVKKWEDQNKYDQLRNAVGSRQDNDIAWLSPAEIGETVLAQKNFPLAKLEVEVRTNAARIAYENLQAELDAARKLMQKSQYDTFADKKIKEYESKFGKIEDQYGKDRIGVSSLFHVWKGKDMASGFASPMKAADLYSGTPAIVEEFIQTYLNPLLDFVKKENLDLIDVSRYAQAVHINNIHRKGIESGWTKEMVETGLSMGTPKMEQARKMLIKFNQALLDDAVEHGLISKRYAQYLKKKFPDYIPMNRIFKEEGSLGSVDMGTGKKFANLFTPFHKLKGSNMIIEEPLDVMMRNAARLIQTGRLNKVGQSVADLAELPGAGVHVEKVREPSGAYSVGAPKPKEQIITVLKNGKPYRYVISQPEVYNLMASLSDDTLGLVGSAVNAIVNLYRRTKTSTPSFWLKDLPLGEIHAFFASGDRLYLPVIDLIRGFGLSIKDPKLVKEWIKEGAGASSTASQDAGYMQAVAQGYTAVGATSAKKIGRFATLSWNKFKEILDYIPRKADESRSLIMFKKYFEGFKKDLDKKLANGTITQKEYDVAIKRAREEAAWRAKDLMNFQRMGGSAKIAGKQLSSTAFFRSTAFLNPAIQGRSKLLRSFINNPGSFLIKGMMLAGFSASVYMYNMKNASEEQKKQIDQAQDWDKASNFFIASPYDKETVYKLPKPYDVSWLFANGTENVLKRMYDDNPQSFKDYAVVNAKDAFPMFGNAFLPMLEAATNYKFRTGGTIVPRSLERLSPEYQYEAENSKTLRKVGEIFNTSPVILEYLNQQYFGDYGKLATRVTDATLLKDAYADKPPMARPDWMTEFLTGRFKVQKGKYQSQNVTDFYENFAEIEEAYYDKKKEKVDDPMAKFYRQMLREGGEYRRISKLQTRRRSVEKSSASPEEKKQQIQDLLDTMDKIAKQANTRIEKYKEKVGD